MAHSGVLMYYGKVNPAHHVGLGKAPGEEARSLLYLPQHNGTRVRPLHDIRENFLQQFKEKSMFDGSFWSLNEYTIVTGGLRYVIWSRK